MIIITCHLHFRDYWSTKWPFNTNVFSNIMSGRRFELLTCYLHLNNNEQQPSRDSANYDKLYKVRPLLDALISNFKMAYTPKQNLSVDESIISYKGRLSWIQYMPKKPTKWGMKAWCLADSSNGYIWNMKIYTGNTYYNANHILIKTNNVKHKTDIQNKNELKLVITQKIHTNNIQLSTPK